VNCKAIGTKLIARKSELCIVKRAWGREKLAGDVRFRQASKRKVLINSECVVRLEAK
jgi:hypothetical protein